MFPLSRLLGLRYQLCFLIATYALLINRSYASTKEDEYLSPELEAEVRLVIPEDDAGGGLAWKDLVVSTADAETIVETTSGMVKNGEVCGILGPSGAGKSSLVTALAGSNPLTTSGQVWRFDHPSEFTTTTTRLTRVYPDHVAWLEQHDRFFDMLTVEETLMSAAFFELPHLTVQERRALVKKKLKALGLNSVAKRRVGSYLTGKSRLSGGERRRLSVALELLTDDKHLFVADEPTTGLDASMSARVMNLIHSAVSDLQIPALCVLHQPRSSVWRALDSVILLAVGGRVCYAGKRSEATRYFKALGYPCPEETNPAEFLVDLISIDPEDPIQAAVDQERVRSFAAAFREYQAKEWELKRRKNSSSRQTDQLVIRPADSLLLPTDKKRPALWPFRWIPRFGALLRRSLRQNFRNKASILARFGISAANAVLLTQLFPTVRGTIPTANSMADRAALLTTAAVTVCNMAFMKAADLFEREHPVVRREQTRQQYTSLEYILAKVIAEMPLDAIFAVLFSTILKQCSGLRIGWSRLTQVFGLLTASGVSLGFLMGGIFAGANLSVNAGFPFLIVLMLVGVINPGGVDPNQPPSAVTQFLKRFSPFGYAINAVLIGEYKDLQFVSTTGFFSRVRELPRLGAMAMVQNGNQVLDALGLANETYGHAMRRLSLLTIANLVGGWIGLARQNFKQRRALRKSRKQETTQHQRQKTAKSTISSTTSRVEPLSTIKRVRL